MSRLSDQHFVMPEASRFDAFDPLYDDVDASGDDEEFFDCHMGPDGYCGAAGSEWCEFDCPRGRRANLERKH